MRLAIVIPTYNEAQNIPELFSRLGECGLSDAAIFIVDDESPDKTAEIALKTPSSLPVTVLSRQGERGLGRALSFGLCHALKFGAQIVVTMDADLSHEPETIPQLVSSINDGADLVLGSRRVAGGSVKGWSAMRNLISKTASGLTRFILGLKSRDVTTGFRAYSSSFLGTVNFNSLQATGYAFQEEMVLLAERAGKKVSEVPINFADRRAGESKLSLKESLSSFITLLRLRFNEDSSRSFFIFLALLLPALAIRLILSPALGSGYDLAAFKFWSVQSMERSFFGFFADPQRNPILNFPNYILYFPILRLLGPLIVSAGEAWRIVLKIPPILADVILGAVIYGAMLRYGRARAALASIFYLYNPMVWYTSAWWGQTDSFHALFMVLTALALGTGKFRRAWVWTALGIFCKLQGIALIPLTAALHLRARGVKQTLLEMIPASIMTVLIILPYAVVSTPYKLLRKMFNVFGQFPLISFNAWNPWAIVQKMSGRFVYDHEIVFGPLSYMHLGLLFFGLSIAAILHPLPRRPSRQLIFSAASLLTFALFLFPTEMHERYLYAFIPLISLLLFCGWLPATIAILESALIFLNVVAVEPWTPGVLAWSNWADQFVWIILTCACFAVLYGWYLKQCRRAAHANDLSSYRHSSS